MLTWSIQVSIRCLFKTAFGVDATGGVTRPLGFGLPPEGIFRS